MRREARMTNHKNAFERCGDSGVNEKPLAA